MLMLAQSLASSSTASPAAALRLRHSLVSRGIRGAAAPSRGHKFKGVARRTQVATMATASTWEQLQTTVAATPRAQFLEEQKAMREVGAGLPHQDCKMRLFGAKEEDVRLTLFRDHAGWCPYCQKVWMMCEEKQIPYKIEKINMRSYGDKPEWFLKKVPSGLLPVIELDGKIITESLVIMQTIENEFPNSVKMIPTDDNDFDFANELMRLERQLFSDWCGLVFRPSGPGGGPRKKFETTLDKVNEALGQRPGPWFLGGDKPSLVDLQYVSHVERMVASCLYWKGMQIRGEGAARWPHIEAWFDAFEQRSSYQATKSDFFTHIRDIPPQYGPGYLDETPEAKAAEEYISGKGDCWKLPLSLGPDQLEPLSPHMDLGEEAARHEAAWKLIGNHENVTKFSCRGAGKPGAKQFQAPLADPYAQPNLELLPAMDTLLRGVAHAMLEGGEAATAAAREAAAAVEPAHKKDAARCLAYLRERVGVPRDMSHPAAMHFRAHLNLFIDQLN